MRALPKHVKTSQASGPSQLWSGICYDQPGACDASKRTRTLLLVPSSACTRAPSGLSGAKNVPVLSTKCSFIVTLKTKLKGIGAMSARCRTETVGEPTVQRVTKGGRHSFRCTTGWGSPCLHVLMLKPEHVESQLYSLAHCNVKSDILTTNSHAGRFRICIWNFLKMEKMWFTMTYILSFDMMR